MTRSGSPEIESAPPKSGALGKTLLLNAGVMDGKRDTYTELPEHNSTPDLCICQPLVSLQFMQLTRVVCMLP